MNNSIDENATIAVAKLYHCWITGLVLGLNTHKGESLAAEFVYRLFRRQHLDKFLPGLKKLGLDQLPHAIAAAKYHYFSNQIGGVKVEYFEESNRKAWIRYPPPRWIWAGTALCAVPRSVNNAMLRGWHSHNGVTLNNPRLGFVCTGTTVDGAPGLEGYYFEYDRELAPEERLRFAKDESCPHINPTTLPKLDIDTWPLIRQAKAYRNYSMEYIRNGLPLLLELLGQIEGQRFGCLCGMQVGMQLYDEVSQHLNIVDNDAPTFIDLLEILLRASGDEITRTNDTVIRTAWRLFAGSETPLSLTEVWRAPFSGLLAAHNRFLRLAHESTDRFSIEIRSD